MLAMLVVALAFSVSADAETRVQNGVEYFVPEGFESKRQEIEESLETATALLAGLTSEVEALERMYDGFVDSFATVDSVDEIGVMIMVYPVEPDDMGDEEYLNDVFLHMGRHAETAAAVGMSEGPEIQARTLSIADEPGQYSRMDVSNAYGRPGDHASFLVKTVEGWNFELIIVGNRELNTPEIDAIIDSVRFADR